ncbi:MAG: 2,3-bisphosphoglycerate-independent phosphoglycerate mutase [Chloroflexi bacterium SZAS-1]|nr:2,3-bisphosphoglycerate-independent phosphoglycerate mutase [Chloroflexi bacterium SZAS-1]
MTEHKRPRPVMLAIMDGWGERDAVEGNGIKLAKTPNIDHWRATRPWTLLGAAEKNVGLPTGQMGNSEVGHLNLGAGFVVMQDITLIDNSIEDGSFFENDALNNAIAHVKEQGSQLHIIGLLGTGGVHSHLSHEKALLELAKRHGLEKVYIHAFTDGRDTMPQSGLGYMADLQSYAEALGVGRVATVTGRYYAMDRDNRWERTRMAYDAMVSGVGRPAASAREAIQRSYDEGVTDEFILPAVVTIDGAPLATVQAGDSIICFNFRADRVRQITKAFVLQDFSGFARDLLRDLLYVTMTEYEKGLPVQIAFENADVEVPLAQVISSAGLRQLHVAETEKYAHVTFFFNGGREEPFPGEDRFLAPSPKEVATYDLKPEMNAYGIRDGILKALADDTYDFIIVNFANADMVGHTGVIPAVIKAVETVDTCIGAVVDAVVAKGGAALITADHGNAELLIDPETGGPHTAHTTNKVPCILVAAPGVGLDHAKLREGGRLSDVAPTILQMLGIGLAPQMTGHSLIVRE